MELYFDIISCCALISTVLLLGLMIGFRVNKAPFRGWMHVWLIMNVVVIILYWIARFILL